MSYTAVITLSRAWLSDPAAPAIDPIVCGTRRSQDASDAVEGELRQFAGKRNQLVERTSELQQIPIVLVALSEIQLVQLRGWKGKVLLLRTVAGDRVFGGFFSVAWRPFHNVSSSDGRSYDVSITFLEATYDEAV